MHLIAVRFTTNSMSLISSRTHSDPMSYLNSPEMRVKLTPTLLMWMNICGITYALVVTLMIFMTIMFWTLPVVHPDPEEYMNRACVIMFFFLNIVINYLLVATKRSYYSETGSGQRLVDPSWKKCLDCKLSTPQKTHHCPLCQRCIQRRDHHCFFTGSCIGYENHIFFMVFCFYCAIGTAYCFYIMQQYMVIAYLQTESISVIHYVLPIAAVECILGYMSLDLFYAIFICYLCVITSIGTSFIFVWQMGLASIGVTSHEYTSGNWSFNRRLIRNLSNTFGSWWILNFMFPVLWIRRQEDVMDLNNAKVL